MIMDVADRKRIRTIMENINQQLAELDIIKEKYNARSRESNEKINNELAVQQNLFFSETIDELQGAIRRIMKTKAHQLDMNTDFIGDV